MWFWIWFVLLGLGLGIGYQRGVRPFVCKAISVGAPGTALFISILVFVFGLVFAPFSDNPAFAQALSAGALWFAIYAIREYALKRKLKAQTDRQQELNRRVTEFYEQSRSQARRVQVDAAQPAPPPVIRQYTMPDIPADEAAETAREEQLTADIACAERTRWARQQLVTALMLRSQQQPVTGDQFHAVPGADYAASTQVSQLKPVKLLPDPSQADSSAADTSLPSAESPVPADSPSGEFTYRPKLVESRFGSTRQQN